MSESVCQPLRTGFPGVSWCSLSYTLTDSSNSKGNAGITLARSAVCFMLPERTCEDEAMRYVVAALAACASIAGCAPQASAPRYEAMTTSSLWTQHALTASPLELAFVEAELGSRGETRLGAQYLGAKTSSAYGRQLYRREEAPRTDVDCGDFNSAAAAQKYFLASGGPISDDDGLDRDGDGLACEWGVTLKRSVSEYRASLRPTVAPRRTSGSRCFVGPRGGTYTISASGAKNYGGC